MILRPCPSQLEREVLVTVDSCTWPQLRRSDRVIGADWSWSQRDDAMASRILAASVPGTRTLAVAGNAHTSTSHTELGVPMGARLASWRPGLQEIRITYGSGFSGTSSHANSPRA
jgi:erythromycin esterase-like protein